LELIQEKSRLNRLIPKFETAAPLVAYMLAVEIEKRQAQEAKIAPENSNGKKRKKKKVAMTTRLKNAFSFRRIGSKSHAVLATEEEDEYGGVSRKMSVSRFSDEDLTLVDDDEFATTAGSSAVTPTLAPPRSMPNDLVLESLSSPKSSPIKDVDAASTPVPSEILSPKSAANAKYPAVMAATRNHHAQQAVLQQSLDMDNARMVLLHETLKLFWRLSKTMNVMIYGNKQGALCVMVYNKYTDRTYNSLYFHRDTIAKLVAERNERIEQNSPNKKKQVASKTGKIGEKAGGGSTGKSQGVGIVAEGVNALPKEVLDYIISDELHFEASSGGSGGSGGVAAGGTGNEDDSHWTLALRGVDTVASAQELAKVRGIQAPHGVFRLKAVAMSRTMSDCHIMAETIATGLRGNFSQLGQENKQAEKMLEQANTMLQQLEIAGRLMLESTPEEGGLLPGTAGATEA
jgi:hypothetical protein